MGDKVGENPAALRAAVFLLSSKNRRGGGGVQTPPSRANFNFAPPFASSVEKCFVKSLKTENEVATVRKIAHPYNGEVSKIDRLSFLFCSKHGEDALVIVTFLQSIPLNFQESWISIVSENGVFFLHPVVIFPHDPPHRVISYIDFLDELKFILACWILIMTIDKYEVQMNETN